MGAGITIASILTAIGMAISVLVEVLLPAWSDGAEGGAALKPLPSKNKKRFERMDYRQTYRLGEFTRKIKCESSGSIAWHHWSNSQLDPQQSCRRSRLSITEPIGIGCRHKRVTLYVHSYQKVRIILRHIVT